MRMRGLLLSASLCLSAGAWPLEVSHSPGVAATALKRDSSRCTAHADIDACYDAIRWHPDDPALLVALGDALARAQRPSDALRNYRRAAALAPGMRGIAAKISAAEAKLSSVRARGNASVEHRFSNAAPLTQSH